MAFRLASLLSLLSLSAAVPPTEIDQVVSGTGQVIDTLQKESVDAAQRFANVSTFDEKLDKVGQQVEAGFDVKLYAQRKEEFAKLAQRSIDISKAAEQEQNTSIAEDKLDEAQETQDNMTKVGNEIDSMEHGLRDTLQKALDGKLKPEVAVADKFSGKASHLQHEAHSMMDPLYSWGDSAEDKADGLNDETNDALSAVDKLVRKYRRHIVRHSRTVQRNTERKVFHPDQDRVSISRKVRRAFRSASGHVATEKYIASLGNGSTNLSALFMGSTGAMALVFTGMVSAAAVGGLVASFILKSRVSHSSEYRLLSA